MAIVLSSVPSAWAVAAAKLPSADTFCSFARANWDSVKASDMRRASAEIRNTYTETKITPT